VTFKDLKKRVSLQTTTA